MKILHVTHHFSPCFGGIERFVEELSAYLNDAGIQSDVLCLNRCYDSATLLPAEEKLGKTNVFRVAFTDLGYYKLARGTMRYIKAYDLVHVHNPGFFMDYAVLLRFLHRKPVVVNTHGGISHTGMSFRKRLFTRLWFAPLLSTASAVVADSRADFNAFSKLVKKGKLKLVENGVDLKRFRGIKRSPVKGTFLFVGRLSANKRLDLLIRAFAVVAKKKPHARLFIVGKDFHGNRKNIEALVKKLELEKSVSFLGAVSEKELMKLYENCGFFVSASSFEGFGIAAVEAMSCGMLPILHGNESFSCFVESGKNGFLVDFNKAEKAAGAMLGAMALGSSELAGMQRNAKQSVQRFSWENKVKEFEALYRSVLNG